MTSELRLWEQDDRFRGRFFKKLTREVLNPLVIEKHGEETGSFFRDAVPPDIESWVKVIRESGENDQMRAVQGRGVMWTCHRLLILDQSNHAQGDSLGGPTSL